MLTLVRTSLTVAVAAVCATLIGCEKTKIKHSTVEAPGTTVVAPPSDPSTTTVVTPR